MNKILPCASEHNFLILYGPHNFVHINQLFVVGITDQCIKHILCGEKFGVGSFLFLFNCFQFLGLFCGEITAADVPCLPQFFDTALLPKLNSVGLVSWG